MIGLPRFEPLFVPIFALALAFSLSSPAVSPATAASCGDDVAGERVACACGDEVVANARLIASDPVVTAPCPSDGLLVRAPADAAAIVLDLGGLTIEGSGAGVGIYVLRGGRGGALVLGGTEREKGVVRGFATGVRVHGRESLAEARDLVVEGNRIDGVVLRGDAPRLVRVDARVNGRDGLRLRGRAPRLVGSAATDNGRRGIDVAAQNPEIDARAAGNAEGQTVRHGRPIGTSHPPRGRMHH